MKDIQSKSGAFIVAFESNKEAMEYIDPDCFERGESSFTGEEGLYAWEKVQERTMKDWQDGMALIKEYKEELRNTELPEMKARQRYTAFQTSEGDEMDYDRFMAGLPPWKVTKREKADGPATVTLVIDTTCHAGRHSQDIFWRGAAALALAELLEEKGYGTEIWVVSGSTAFGYQGPNNILMLAANLKKPEDPFDISTLTNSVAGWFYRTVTFALIRTVGKKFNRHVMDSLGREYIPVAVDLNQLTTDELRVFSAGYYTKGGALQLMRDEVARISAAEETGKQAE